MREIYKQSDFKEALNASLERDSFFTILSTNLLKVKLDRLTVEHKEIMRLYNQRYKTIIEENKDKDPKEYKISQVIVSKINKTVKKIDSLTKSINFYTEQIESINDVKSLEKRKKIILDLVSKIG